MFKLSPEGKNGIANTPSENSDIQSYSRQMLCTFSIFFFKKKTSESTYGAAHACMAVSHQIAKVLYTSLVLKNEVALIRTRFSMYNNAVELFSSTRGAFES